MAEMAIFKPAAAKLDGFLESYINNGCGNDNCEDCSLCRNWAEKAVTIKTKKNNELLVMAESLDESIHDSSLWL